jgi:MFS family permease
MTTQPPESGALPVDSAVPIVTPSLPVVALIHDLRGSVVARVPLFAPLAIPAYTLFWMASVLIFLSSNFRDIAFASIALDLTGRPSGLSTLQSIGAIVNVLVLLFGGLASDRFRPHRVLLVAMLAHAAVTVPMVALSWSGSLVYWQLTLVVIVGGVAGGLFGGSFFAVMPDLLPADRIRTANALGTMTENLGRFVFPPLAGLTLAAVGVPPALAVGSATALLAAVFLGRIRATAHESTGAGDPIAGPETPAIRTGTWQRLNEGVRAARADGATWTLIWAGGVLVPGSFGAYAVGIPSLAKLTLGAGDAGIGLLYGALGAGALAGALCTGAVRAMQRPGLVIVVCVVAEGLALILTGLAPALWLAAALHAVAGLFQAVRIVLAVTIIQSRTPAEVRGRVISVAVLAAIVPQIAVLALAGYVGDVLGPPVVMAACGALVMVGGLLIAGQRSVRALAA